MIDNYLFNRGQWLSKQSMIWYMIFIFILLPISIIMIVSLVLKGNFMSLIMFASVVYSSQQIHKRLKCIAVLDITKAREGIYGARLCKVMLRMFQPDVYRRAQLAYVCKGSKEDLANTIRTGYTMPEYTMAIKLEYLTYANLDLYISANDPSHLYLHLSESDKPVPIVFNNQLEATEYKLSHEIH